MWASTQRRLARLFCWELMPWPRRETMTLVPASEPVLWRDHPRNGERLNNAAPPFRFLRVLRFPEKCPANVVAINALARLHQWSSFPTKRTRLECPGDGRR
jgi:hypothetical protein